MFDVTALGELLIDFTENGASSQGNPLFEANPGGAPCNVLAMLKKLGRSAAFIGKVGDDMFGHSLRGVVQAAGIDVSGLLLDRWSMELFVNDGEHAASFTVYTPQSADGIRFEAEGAALLDAEKYDLEFENHGQTF